MRAADEINSGKHGESGDLFGDRAAVAPAPARNGAGAESKMSRADIIAQFGVSDLKSPRAHLCFRCDAPTGLAFGRFRPGEKIVFACKAHFGELQ